MGSTTSISHSSAITKAALRKLPEVSHLSSCLTRRQKDNDDNGNGDSDEEIKKEVIQCLKETRNKIISMWKEREEFYFTKSLIIMRPVSSTALSRLVPETKENESDLSDVSLAAFGMFHSMILLRSNESEYLLDRCVEGIRLIRLEDLQENAISLKKCFSRNQPISLVIFGDYSDKINSHKLAEWIEQESKVDYNLFNKNCIHFTWNFASKFTVDKNVTFGKFWSTIRDKFWDIAAEITDSINSIDPIELEEISKILALTNTMR